MKRQLAIFVHDQPNEGNEETNTTMGSGAPQDEGGPTLPKDEQTMPRKMNSALGEDLERCSRSLTPNLEDLERSRSPNLSRERKDGTHELITDGTSESKNVEGIMPRMNDESDLETHCRHSRWKLRLLRPLAVTDDESFVLYDPLQSRMMRASFCTTLCRQARWKLRLLVANSRRRQKVISPGRIFWWWVVWKRSESVAVRS